MTNFRSAAVARFVAALAFLSIGCLAPLGASQATTLSTTPGVILDAPRNDTPSLQASALLQFALRAPPNGASYAVDTPEWIAWNASMHEALPRGPFVQNLCPANASVQFHRDWFWSFCSATGRHGSYTDECNALFEHSRATLGSCIAFHRERVFNYTGLYPREAGGFWSSMCRCVHINRFIEDNMYARPESGLSGVCNIPSGGSSRVNQGYVYQAYRSTSTNVDDSLYFGNILAQIENSAVPYQNSGGDMSIIRSPHLDGRWLLLWYNCSVDAYSYADMLNSIGGDMNYARNALWAIPPASKLVAPAPVASNPAPTAPSAAVTSAPTTSVLTPAPTGAAAGVTRARGGIELVLAALGTWFILLSSARRATHV